MRSIRILLPFVDHEVQSAEWNTNFFTSKGNEIYHEEARRNQLRSWEISKDLVNFEAF